MFELPKKITSPTSNTILPHHLAHRKFDVHLSSFWCNHFSLATIENVSKWYIEVGMLDRHVDVEVNAILELHM